MDLFIYIYNSKKEFERYLCKNKKKKKDFEEGGG
jgi:hypothetical protein